MIGYNLIAIIFCQLFIENLFRVATKSANTLLQGLEIIDL